MSAYDHTLTAELLKLAEAATPGPWHAMDPLPPSRTDHGYRTIAKITRSDAGHVLTSGAIFTPKKGWSFGTKADAAFIASAHRLADQLRAADEEVSRLLVFLEMAKGPINENASLRRALALISSGEPDQGECIVIADKALAPTREEG